MPPRKAGRHTLPCSGAGGGQEDVDPSDHDQNDLSNSIPEGKHTHANGPEGEQ